MCKIDVLFKFAGINRKKAINIQKQQNFEREK